MRLLTLPSVLVLAATTVLTGCAGFQTPAVTTSGPVTIAVPNGMKGSTYGGRQPINGATISLYQTGTTGYGAGATLINTTTTNANGGFTIPAFSCTAGTQLYVTSVGGDPYGNGENNTSAILMAGLTSCSNVEGGAITFISMNEVTTVATVWALPPFMSSTNIGAPSTNQTGLASAFADISTLVNLETGVSPGTGSPSGTGALPTGTTVPNAELNMLGDALASCVNSINGTQTDSTTPTSTSCSYLFSAATPSGGSAPVDTVGTALNIARNPGNNVSNVIIASGTGPAVPYQPIIAAANDLTVAILYTGNGSNGISSPSAVAVDASGNIWIANNPANPGTPSVTELNHLGAPLSGSTGYTAGSLNAPSAIAIDGSGNAWIANGGNNTLTELSSSGTNVGSSPFSGGGLSTPTSISFDGLGDIWLSNSGNNSASEFSSTGTALSGSGGYTATGVSAPVGVAVNPH